MDKVEPDFNDPTPLTGDEDEETIAAIDRRIQAADGGRTVSVEEAREMDFQVDCRVALERDLSYYSA
jgi:hypothetical protein